MLTDLQAASEAEAVSISHLKGCNPGGEIAMVAVPEPVPDLSAWRDRLLSRADVEVMDLVLTVRLFTS